jgi:Delta24-sterol reductase
VKNSQSRAALEPALVVAKSLPIDGRLGAPKISLIKLTLTPQLRKETITKHVVQNIIVPLSELPRRVELFEQWFNVYPLLVYPIRIFDRGKQGFLRPPSNKAAGKNWQMFFDLGVYGVPDKVARGKPWDAVRSVRNMEIWKVIPVTWLAISACTPIPS